MILNCPARFASLRVRTVVLVTMTLCVAVGVLQALSTPHAGAQSPTAVAANSSASGATPMLTVSDTHVARCGTITATGTSFAPNTKIVMVVSGKTMAEHPTSDNSGAFTFATSVPCEQGSGSVQIRAFDGITTVTIEIAVGGSVQSSTTIQLIEAVPATSRIDQLALTAARVLLLTIAAVELAVLVGWRKRRTRRRATPLDSRRAGSGPSVNRSTTRAGRT